MFRNYPTKNNSGAANYLDILLKFILMGLSLSKISAFLTQRIIKITDLWLMHSLLVFVTLIMHVSCINTRKIFLKLYFRYIFFF